MTEPQPTSDAFSNLYQRLDIDYVLQTARLGVWEYDPATGLVNWDERAQALFGIAKKPTMPYEQAVQHIHPQDRQRVEEAVGRSLNPHSDGMFDQTYRTIGVDDDQLRWVRFQGKASFSQAGQLLRYGGVAQDVTQQVLSQQSQQQMLDLLEQSPVGIALISEQNLTFQMANPFYGRMVGRTPEQLVGVPLLEALPELAGQGFDQLLQGVIATGTPFIANEVEVALVRTGRAETIYVDLAYQPWRDAGGRILGVLVVVTEVTQQVLARQQLQVSTDQMRSMVESAPFPIGVYTGPQMQIRFANQAIIDIYGKGPDVIGRNYPELLPELAGQQIFEQLQQVYATGTGFASGTQRVTIDHDGASVPYYFKYTFTPLFDGQGQVYGVMNMAADVTELELARQQTQASEVRFRRLIEEAPVATCLFVGRDLRVEVANDTMLAYWGKSQTVIGKPLEKAVPELVGQPFLALLDEVFTSGQTYEAKATRAELEVEGTLKTYYFDFTYKPLRDEKGKVYAIMDMAVDVTQQVLAQQALQQSEARFQNLVRTANVGMIVMQGADFRVTVVNDAYCRLIDHRVEDLLDQPIFTVLPSVESDFRPLLERVMATGEPFAHPEARYQVRGTSGQLIVGFTDTVYQPYREADGRVTGVMAVVQDITQLVSSRQEIAQSEARLQAILDNARAAIGVYAGPDMVIQHPNQLFIDLLGKGPGIVGKTLRGTSPELATETQSLLAILDEVYRTGVGYTSTGVLIKIFRNGELTNNYYSFSYTPVLDPAGKTYQIVVVATDVTEQIKARQALEENQAALNNAIELAELGTWTLDVASGATQLSAKHADMFGLTLTHLPYETALAIVHPDDRERVGAAFERAMQPGSDGRYQAEYRIINARTGSQQHIRARGETRFEEGQPVSISGTTQDVTLEREAQQLLEAQVLLRTQELQLANQDLQRSNDNLQQFAYVASHDLQEPLRKIQSFSSLLEQHLGERLDEAAGNYLTRITNAGARMSLLIKDLLSYSRISTRQQVFGPISLNAVVSYVVETLSLAIEQRQAQLQIDELPVVNGDGSQLNQLFQNLLSNAIKFTPPDQAPRVHVAYFQRQPGELPPEVRPHREAPFYHQISVSDQGVGFDMKYLDRVFQVFQRLHGKDQFPGTGVGLAICQRVVENHGGAITASSQPGQGATFCVYLPA